MYETNNKAKYWQMHPIISLQLQWMRPSQLLPYLRQQSSGVTKNLTKMHGCKVCTTKLS